MIYVISNAFFSHFHSTTSGAVLNSTNIDISISNCALEYVTADDSAACFLFSSSTVNISKTCFFHSQIVCDGNGNGKYGNVYHIINSNPAAVEYLSAYECGYDPSKVGDSTFATSSTSFKAKYINTSNCSTRHGATTFNIYLGPSESESQMDFMTSVNAFGSLSYIYVVEEEGKSKINNFNIVHSSNICGIFWLSDYLTLTNFIIYNNTYEHFSYHSNIDNIYIYFSLNNCFADVSIEELPSLKPINSITYFVDIIMPAEICELQSNTAITCIKSKSLIHLGPLIYIFLC